MSEYVGRVMMKVIMTLEDGVEGGNLIDNNTKSIMKLYDFHCICAATIIEHAQ